MERKLSLACANTLYSATLEEFGHPNVGINWCSWNHPAEHASESQRSLMHMLRVLARTWHWSDYIAPGDTCIDIGAHSGDTTIPMAVCAYGGSDRRGTVVAVEPNGQVSPVLEINLSLNHHLADFRFAGKAITRERLDAVEIADHGNANCNGGIIDEGYSPELQSKLRGLKRDVIVAEGIPLADLCAELLSPAELERLTFIKSDCEGFDKEILRSSAGLLDRYRPTLFVEWFAYFSASDTEDFFAAIDEIGYRAFDPITREPARPEVRSDDVLLIHRSKRA